MRQLFKGDNYSREETIRGNTVYQGTKIAKAGFDDWSEHPSVQINSSSPWLVTSTYESFTIGNPL